MVNEEYAEATELGFRQGIKAALAKIPKVQAKIIVSAAFQPDYVIELSTIRESIEALTK